MHRSLISDDNFNKRNIYKFWEMRVEEKEKENGGAGQQTVVV